MSKTVAQTICDATRHHLTHNGGKLFGQCVTAVGWIGGTVPEMSEEEGIVELSMADVAGAGIATGAALAGIRPIYVIRYQGFMWYNAAPILNYAAKSKDMWNVPCPIFVRSIAMEGAIGPVASACHHGMVMRMPGIPVIAPMTPGEWMTAWNHFLEHDDPVYCSEHRRSFPIDHELPDQIEGTADITLIPISASRLNAIEAAETLRAEGLRVHIAHCLWLKPFQLTNAMVTSLTGTKRGLVIDSDFETAAAGRSIAYELMHRLNVPVKALGLEDRSAGFSAESDNPTPTPQRIADAVRNMVSGRVKTAAF